MPTALNHVLPLSTSKTYPAWVDANSLGRVNQSCPAAGPAHPACLLLDTDRQTERWVDSKNRKKGV